ncbi:MAG: MFS transporter, partial [Candidatus Latescibacterota bacterium]
MLLSCFFVNFVFFGAVVIIVGAAVPEILRTYSWRYVEMGAILAGGSIGYFVSTFVCGILLRRWGPKRVIVYGLVLQAAGLAAFGQMPS